MKHKVGDDGEGPSESPDRHSQRYLGAGPVGQIADGTDIITAGRIARVALKMRFAMRDNSTVPFGTPGLLHYDRDEKNIHAKMILLDKPTMAAWIPKKLEGQISSGDVHWAGAHGEWMAYVKATEPDRWTLFNIYRNKAQTLPSLQEAGITACTSGWPPGDPFSYKYGEAVINLLKIQIPNRPFLNLHKGAEVLHYDAIAVFDKLVAFASFPRMEKWTILPHACLAPDKYVDAVASNGYGRQIDSIYAVTAPRGDVVFLQPFMWSIHHVECTIEAADDPDTRCWWLAPSRINGYGGLNLVWIHTRGAPSNAWPNQTQITHMGTALYRHDQLRCHVFIRSIAGSSDPVQGTWGRVDHFNGKSAFLGTNYPFFLDAPATAAARAAADEEEPATADEEEPTVAVEEPPAAADEEEPAAAEEEDIPLFQPDCVFTTQPSVWHLGLSMSPTPIWSCMHLNGGAAIGSFLHYKVSYYGWSSRSPEAPMWYIPTVPPGPGYSDLDSNLGLIM